MCNLYRMTKSASEVANLFGVAEGSPGNFAGEVYPGYPGLVVAGGELRSMNWGFPLARTSKTTGKPLKPKPVNNTRADKLGTYFWRHSFEERRCVIPVTSFAEWEGKTGNKSKVWFSVEDEPIFACAGIWRDTDEWGPSYSMIMTDANNTVAPVHDRMPVILPREAWEKWINAATDEARSLCTPFAGALALDR